jgi:hypothetical protein
MTADADVDVAGLLTLCRASSDNLATAEAVVSQIKLSRNRYAQRAVELAAEPGAEPEVEAQVAAAMKVSVRTLQQMATAARLTH